MGCAIRREVADVENTLPANSFSFQEFGDPMSLSFLNV
jgi:hypothetical protein